MNSLTLWGLVLVTYCNLTQHISGPGSFPMFRLCLKDVELLVLVKIVKFRRVGLPADEILFSNVLLISVIAINDIFC